MIIGADADVAGKYKKKNAETAFAYAFEKIELYAISLGIGTLWLAAAIVIGRHLKKRSVYRKMK